jgi:hypothetical protein
MIFEVIIGHHSTLTAAVHLRRVNILGIKTADIFDACTHHTKVQPALFANIVWVLGLRAMLMKRGISSSGFFREAMLRRLRRAATVRMVVLVIS